MQTNVEMTPITTHSLNDTISTLLAGIRHCKPKCAVCARPLSESITGVRTRESEAGVQEKLCRFCFVDEIAEKVSNQLP
jgi:hypothetical protein